MSFAIQVAALSLYTGSCGECAHDVWKSCSDVESEFLPGKWFFEHTENGTFEITKGADDALLYKGSTGTWSRDHPDEGHGNLEGELKKVDSLQWRVNLSNRSHLTLSASKDGMDVKHRSHQLTTPISTPQGVL